MSTTIYSWNVNGIRALEKKGFVDIVERELPDVLALQETKAHPDQLSESLLNIDDYFVSFMSAQKKGYSGVCIYSLEEPSEIENLGIEEFDSEGRVIIAHFEHYTVINCYFPNSQSEGKRIEYKTAFNHAIKDKCDEFTDMGLNVVLVGDYNVAHQPIDLTNPKTNGKNPGYLPEERSWMSAFLDDGYVDTFRYFHSGEPEHYSWWSYRFSARERNIGWRIDYCCVNESFMECVTDAKIHPAIVGSDHCPVSITVDTDGLE